MFNTLPKIHIKHLNWLMPLLLSGLMSGSISGFNLLLNKGLVHNFFHLWLKSWSLSWLIAFPLIMVFLPLVRKFLMQFVHLPDQPRNWIPVIYLALLVLSNVWEGCRVQLHWCRSLLFLSIISAITQQNRLQTIHKYGVLHFNLFLWSNRSMKLEKYRKS